jgi:hypothetical protein
MGKQIAEVGELGVNSLSFPVLDCLPECTPSKCVVRLYWAILILDTKLEEFHLILLEKSRRPRFWEVDAQPEAKETE